MIRSALLLILFSPLGVHATDYYTYFTLQDGGNATCNGNYIESATVDLDCDNDYCPLGTTVTLSGDVTVASGGLPSETVSIGLSASGYTIYSLDDVNLCEYLNGGGCPNQGTYSISDYSLDLPDPSSSLNLAGSMGMAISVGAKIYFETGDYEQCTFKIALVNRSTSYSLGYIGMAGFMMFGVATTLGIKRRKVATIQLEEEQPATDGTYNHFELMPKPQGVQV
eukprot:CAMPEP_0113612606 /NCGR_PEP_ID=MMETSP0017_2-20120614/6191_1 /TAXON_ID=2856 /ORGANISM="Cylindrotheca closterium" /LENGTH=223 /DNA_ID=CAMNT_0000521655 /DNA_START=49 /DNA_END=720 /DNA_ORIENTATION=+ /assembly_acc=CAM_ASM_000147